MSFSPINVELSIGDTIRAIGEIENRAREEARRQQDKTLTELRQQLEITFAVIYKLEDLFIEILRGYRDPLITGNYEALQEHLNQTNTLLESRKLLPYLDTATAAIGAAASSPRFEVPDYEAMVSDLAELEQKLDDFRLTLGPRGVTAPGIWLLIELRDLAKLRLASLREVTSEGMEDAGVSPSGSGVREARKDVPPDKSNRAEEATASKLANTATEAFSDYDWALTSDIRRLIGRVKINS